MKYGFSELPERKKNIITRYRFKSGQSPPGLIVWEKKNSIEILRKLIAMIPYISLEFHCKGTLIPVYFES